MSEAVITVLEIVKADPGFVKLKDASNKTWNCNEQKLLRTASDGNPVFHPGRKLEVSYNEYQPEGQKFASRYINDARPSDKPNTWPDKEPYRGGGGGHAPSNGGFKKNGEFRTPEQIMRGEALAAAVACSEKAEDALELAKTYFYPFILGEFEAKVADVKEAFGATDEADDDIPFDPGSPF